ncbi:MAG TPA: PQQ-binding-like beta-propeller repeat protein [Acidobacteriota bacterium]|nr:PQQ-binding-like beta-propeller repeat protein [Acidobacteriota bacterium]
MSRRMILPLLLLSLALPVYGQLVGDQPTAGFTNARTYTNADVLDLRPPLRLFETIDLTGITNATSLVVFEDKFLVGQTGSPVNYRMFSRSGNYLWGSDLSGSGGPFRFIPAIGGQLVILGGEGTTSIRAVSLIDGTPLWSDTVGNTNGRFPAVTDNRVVYHGANRIVVANRNGSVFWQSAVTTAVSAVAVRDDSLYYLAKDRTLRAINLQMGTDKWPAMTNVAGDGASLIATEKYIFLNDPAGGYVATINAQTGVPDWNGDVVFLDGEFSGTPGLALGYGRLYAFRSNDGSGNSAISAYDPDTGDELWVVTDEGTGLDYAFLADNTIYYYQGGSQVRARDAATGALLWSIEKPGVRGLGAAKGELYVLREDAIDVYVTTNEIFMPQMANAGGQKTIIMLANPGSTPVKATVYFYGEDGSSISVPLQSYGVQDQVEVTVPAGATLSLQTDPAVGNAMTGWVRVISEAPLRGTVNFQFAEGEEVTREAGVADSVPTGSANIYVNVEGDFNAGVAMANPTEQDSNVTLRLLDSSGAEIASKSLELPSGAHSASFVVEMFPDEVGDSFEGTLAIEADVPIVITAIRTKGGLQISSYPVAQAVR